MRKMKNVRKGYIDGVLAVYENKSDNKSSFNAVKNALNEDDLTKLVTLRYNTETKRISDVEFAEAHDRTLSLKVSTPLRHVVTADQYAITAGVLYTIYNVDYDEHEDRMYLYMEEVRKVNE